MDNEATKIINPETGSNPSQSGNANTEKTESKSSKYAKRAATVAMGAVAGAGIAEAAEHLHSNNSTTEETAVHEDAANTAAAASQQPEVSATAQQETADHKDEVAATVETPAEHEAILMTDEGIRVAHVNDDMSFSEAFASARQQLGAGGVFEWHGKVYGTYYENEWNQMSSAERAEWQTKIDYSDVTDGEYHTPTQHNSHESDAMQADASYIDDPEAANSENEVHVIGVHEADFGQNQHAIVIGLENTNGDHALVVDVDSDGSIDLLVHDDNGDGQITNDEMHDISNSELHTQDFMTAYEAEHDHNMLLADHDMPDYMNDADVII